MNTADTYVRARIDTITKIQATETLKVMGLSVSDAIRLLMRRIVSEQRLPFEIKIPNKTTQNAISELESGHGKKFNNLSDFIEELNADN